MTNNILSPVSGKIEAIDYIDDHIKIYCKTNICNSFVVKSPATSKIQILDFQNGLNLKVNSYKASLLNEQVTYKFDNFTLKLIGGFCNANFKFTKKENVMQGEKLATLLDGMAILSINNTYDVNVALNDKLVAGQTVLVNGE